MKVEIVWNLSVLKHKYSYELYSAWKIFVLQISLDFSVGLNEPAKVHKLEKRITRLGQFEKEAKHEGEVRCTSDLRNSETNILNKFIPFNVINEVLNVDVDAYVGYTYINGLVFAASLICLNEFQSRSCTRC